MSHLCLTAMISVVLNADRAARPTAPHAAPSSSWCYFELFQDSSLVFVSQTTHFTLQILPCMLPLVTQAGLGVHDGSWLSLIRALRGPSNFRSGFATGIHRADPRLPCHIASRMLKPAQHYPMKPQAPSPHNGYLMARPLSSIPRAGCPNSSSSSPSSPLLFFFVQRTSSFCLHNSRPQPSR